tara:strand:- start:560 stop:733 length:174 start_codon:yes stop_codon:yes gene_type:complete
VGELTVAEKRDDLGDGLAAVLNPRVRIGHHDVIYHAVDFGFADPHFAVTRAARPMGE